MRPLWKEAHKLCAGSWSLQQTAEFAAEHISAVHDVRELTETFDYEIISEAPLFHTEVMIFNKLPLVNVCHGAHTRRMQEHADEDVNSNNSL